MILTAQDKKMLSDIRIKKAYEFLDDAKANLDDSRYGTAINRSYYALLNAARSLLILEGSDPETHEGVITMLSLRFIKTGILSVEVIKKYKLLFSRRTDVDYGDFETVDSEDAVDSVSIAGKTIKEIDAVRKRLSNELK